MNEFLIVFGMFLVTFGVRYPVLALVGRMRLPEIVMLGLKYVPPCILTAIVVPAMLIPDGSSIRIDITNAPFYAGIMAALVAWRTKNLLLTILIGMLVLWVLKWLFIP